MGSWVMPRAREVLVVFLSGCTRWPWPNKTTLTPVIVEQPDFLIFSVLHPFHVSGSLQSRAGWLSTHVQASPWHGGRGTAEATCAAPQSQHHHHLLLFSSVDDTRPQHPSHLTRSRKSSMSHRGTDVKCVNTTSSPRNMS